MLGKCYRVNTHMKTKMNRMAPRELDSRRREFGSLLRRLRRDRFLTCEELAKKAGKLSRSTLAAIERGSRQAGAKVSERLADALMLAGETRQNFLLASLKTTAGELLPWSTHGLNPELFQPLAEMFMHHGIRSSDNYHVRLNGNITKESPEALKRAATRLAEKAEELSRSIRGALDGSNGPFSVETEIEYRDGTIMLVQLLPASSKVLPAPSSTLNTAEK